MVTQMLIFPAALGSPSGGKMRHSLPTTLQLCFPHRDSFGPTWPEVSLGCRNPSPKQCLDEPIIIL